MQNNQPKNDHRPARAALRQRVETIYCARHGRRVAVTFDTSPGLLPMRTDVAACPLRAQGACDLACLSPVGGKAFS
ncbi:MAG: hypothetical protein O2967_22270 [Proteobacteria bacterium]|nr:hypothetical protein [Pseudomonadota bacterium]